MSCLEGGPANLMSVATLRHMFDQGESLEFDELQLATSGSFKGHGQSWENHHSLRWF